MAKSEKLYKVGPWLVHKGIDDSYLYSNMHTQKTCSHPPDMILLHNELQNRCLPFTIHETFDKKLYYYNTETKKSTWIEPKEVSSIRHLISTKPTHKALINQTKSKTTPLSTDSKSTMKEDFEKLFKELSQRDVRNFLQCCVDKTPYTDKSFSDSIYYLMKDERFYTIKNLGLKKFIYEKFYLYIQNEVGKRKNSIL